MHHPLTPLPHAPATARNREPILAQLMRVLPHSGKVLEIASGTGEHAEYFARSMPGSEWQPSDADPENLAGIALRVGQAALNNLKQPVLLDARSDPWPVSGMDAVFCANMIHIAPWAAALGLLSGAARTLGAGGLLCLYGPFLSDVRPTAPSNVAFDRWLREQNEAWGVRRLEAVSDVAAEAGFTMRETIEMPANNLLVVFVKDG